MVLENNFVQAYRAQEFQTSSRKYTQPEVGLMFSERLFVLYVGYDFVLDLFCK